MRGVFEGFEVKIPEGLGKDFEKIVRCRDLPEVPDVRGNGRKLTDEDLKKLEEVAKVLAKFVDAWGPDNVDYAQIWLNVAQTWTIWKSSSKSTRRILRRRFGT